MLWLFRIPRLPSIFSLVLSPIVRSRRRHDDMCAVGCDGQDGHTCIPHTKTSHPENPIPEEPLEGQNEPSPRDHEPTAVSSPSLGSTSSVTTTDTSNVSSPSLTTPNSEQSLVNPADDAAPKPDFKQDGPTQERRASTHLVASNNQQVQQLIGIGEGGGTQYVGRPCCGGGCCFLNADKPEGGFNSPLVPPPDNEAYRSLKINIQGLCRDTKLTNIVDVPETTVSFTPIPEREVIPTSTVDNHPPDFLKPHPPYDVFPAKVHHARELTKPGAERKTFHLELDVTDYPAESGDVDFIVGGAIGICPSNPAALVDHVFDLLGVPRWLRDRAVTLGTRATRWPTIWGEETPRALRTSRRELLTWCTDLQSFPPTKPLLRLLAEHADAANEKKVLLYLASAQGQAAFCDLRAGPHVTLAHLLAAFPSARPPLDALLSGLRNLMPRFYSLSQDPHVSVARRDAALPPAADEATAAVGAPTTVAPATTPDGTDETTAAVDAPTTGAPAPTPGGAARRVIEIAVTLHESRDWRGEPKAGVGSGFLARCAAAAAANPAGHDVRVPMFRGLMANPFAREFGDDGPLLLVGAGVGIAPFRGFVRARLRAATCAHRVWVLQGVRDSLLDELYTGEWGVDDARVKTVVQSRRGTGRYVQDEVRNQADLVWYIINAVHGRIFVCGSSKGMGEGVEQALVDVSMDKGHLNREQAAAFWEQKKKEGQYVAVSLARCLLL